MPLSSSFPFSEGSWVETSPELLELRSYTLDTHPVPPSAHEHWSHDAGMGTAVASQDVLCHVVAVAQGRAAMVSRRRDV